MTPLSILDLARVTEGADARAALDNARDLAAHAEQWGYRRIWVAEHHNMPGDRQRRDVDRDRPHRRGHAHDPGRGGRDHAAEPRALCHRRAVRHAGAPVSGPHRPRAWPRPGHGPAHLARAAARAGGRRELSAGRSRAAGLSCAGGARPANPGGSGGRNGRADLDPRVEQFRRDARRRIRAALFLRLAFRARPAPSRARDLSQPLQAVEAARPTLTRWSGSISSPPRRTRKRAVWPRPSRCRSPTSFAARAA